MATKVTYKVGSKETYLSLAERSSSALYFCTDTRELFKGDDLFSDGLRIVANYDALPSFQTSADGILYFCEDSGCGYVLNAARDAWLPVVHGVDNKTIEINTAGLMAVKSVPIASVTGLADELKRIEEAAVAGVAPIATAEVAGVVKPGVEFSVADDGTLSLTAVEIIKITGLEERLSSIEQIAVGGVHYKGSVATQEDLPADAAQGDLYEVTADNSEWCFNGEQWFEYGKTIDMTPYATVEMVNTVTDKVAYEIFSKPEGVLVNYMDQEIRIMCPANIDWRLQQSGENANPNAYYVGFKAYAPEGAVSFKEDLAEIINDPTMYYFENNDFAGVDKFGRKFSVVWLAVALYDEATGTWSCYGDQSTIEKMIGYDYSVEWYNEDGVRIAMDTIRINLTNENCHNSSTPYYLADMQASIDALEEMFSWGEM